MKILILSRNNNYYSTARLIETGKARGHEVLVADPITISLAVEGRNPQAFLEGESLQDIDVVIPRIGMISAEFGVAVVKQFQMMGVTVINNSLSIMRARDKLRCIQILTRQNIKVPRTVMTRNPAEMKKAIQYVGGPPVVLKFLQGTQGIGVILAESFKSAESTLDAFWSMNQNLLIQEYIQESEGRDIRVIVTRDKVLAVMRRQAKAGEFRSNIHRGGWGEIVEPPRDLEEVALHAANIIGLDVGGVDIMESKRGPLVLEINASPGIEGIEKITGRDLAQEIILYAENKVEEKKAKAIKGVVRKLNIHSGKDKTAIQEG
ncbi:MAG: RimK family alpha-L-glutamate ligase [Planctomycetota bacterium]